MWVYTFNAGALRHHISDVMTYQKTHSHSVFDVDKKIA